ncbi:MAG: T9SS type A sorting domain-containing protein [Candidatus Kapaibacterium sp.]
MKMRSIFLVIISIVIAYNPLLSQTFPEAFDLSSGDYSFTEWKADSKAGDYPKNMIFHTTSTQDPSLDTEMNDDWTLGYDLTAKSRINGMGELGVAFNNTSQKNEGAGFLGAAVLGLNTAGRRDIRIEWTGRIGGFDKSSDRRYAIRLQMSIDGEQYIDVLNEGDVVELDFDYTYKEGDSLRFSSVLPPWMNDQEIIYIRWLYFQKSANAGGGRPELLIDEIRISSEKITSVMENAAENIAIEIFPNPSKDFLRIKINSPFEQNATLSICDAAGRHSGAIFEGTLCPGEQIFTYPTGSLSSGLYFIKVNCGGVVRTIKNLVE